jgi:hypothetical protein
MKPGPTLKIAPDCENFDYDFDQCNYVFMRFMYVFGSDDVTRVMYMFPNEVLKYWRAQYTSVILQNTSIIVLK